MKKLSFLLSLSLLVVAAPAFAAMPNYTGTDYKQAPACTSVDHGVYEYVGNGVTLVGCVAAFAWDRAMAYAASLQTSGITIAAGQTVRLPDGRLDTCNLYLIRGCVAPAGSVIQ